MLVRDCQIYYTSTGRALAFGDDNPIVAQIECGEILVSSKAGSVPRGCSFLCISSDLSGFFRI